MTVWDDWFERLWAEVEPSVPLIRRVRLVTGQFVAVCTEQRRAKELSALQEPCVDTPGEADPFWHLRIAQGVSEDLIRSAPFTLADRHDNGSVPRAVTQGFRVSWNPQHTDLSLMDVRRRRGVWLTGRSLPAWDYCAPVRRLFQWVAARSQVLLAHAGSVVVDGKALLLVGRGGAGKSTAVASAVASGLQTVGEDYLQVGLEAVAPIFRTLKLRPQSPMYEDRYSWFGEDFAAGSSTESACVWIPSGRIADSARLYGVVLMDPASPSRPVAAPESDALRSLLHSTVLQSNHDQAWALKFARQAVYGRKAWRLGHTNPADLAPILSELLEA